MASGNWDQNNTFRRQYGNNPNSRPSRRYASRNSSNRQFSYSNYDREQQQERFTNNNSINHNNYDYADDSTSQSRISDDERTHYAINLQLKPVEMGIIASNGLWNQEFKGLGAFNHYFGLCAPTRGLGYTLADVWDGYFHITLAKFITQLTSFELEENFREFKPTFQDLGSIRDIEFQATKLETHPGTSRPKKMRDINFVVFPVDLNPIVGDFYSTKLKPLLTEIKQKTRHIKWDATPLAKLHVTVRKYSNFTDHISKIKIQDFPIKFRCSHLEIKQTREQATSRYKAEPKEENIWWTGVTEDNGKCSGCKTPITSAQWEGFCLACGKYEAIIPLWSTTGDNNRHHSLQPEHAQDDTPSEPLVVQHVALHE